MEVVPGDGALEVRILLVDLRSVVLDERPRRLVEGRLQVVARDDRLVLRGVEDDLAGLDQRAVREHDRQLLRVRVRDPVPHRVRPGGVVADSADDGRPRGGGRVGRELQPVLGEAVVEVVLNDAGLDHCPPVVGADLQNLVHVRGEVQHHAARPDGLSAQRGAGPPRDDRDTVVGGDFHRGLNVRDRARDHDPGRSRLIDAPVRRVQHLRVLVELDLSRDPLAEVRCQVPISGHVRPVVTERGRGRVQVRRVAPPRGFGCHSVIRGKRENKTFVNDNFARRSGSGHRRRAAVSRRDLTRLPERRVPWRYSTRVSTWPTRTGRRTGTSNSSGSSAPGSSRPRTVTRGTSTSRTTPASSFSSPTRTARSRATTATGTTTSRSTSTRRSSRSTTTAS
ncbi:hypothetical protein BN903_34 [Halorubrum sp. AJ67]|nr:hypothetical protein BN903_34 [Halorubrum sp. AJ67]